MIHGAHVIIYSKDADADRAFIRDVLGFNHVDAGGGWLIFGLPPAEVAVHPASGSGSHEMYLMCDGIEKFRAEMAGHGVSTGAVQEERWGVITDVMLPSGAKLGVYEPRHPRPAVANGAAATKSSGSKSRGSKSSGSRTSGSKSSGSKSSATKSSGSKSSASKSSGSKSSASKSPGKRAAPPKARAKQPAKTAANKQAVMRPAAKKSAAARAPRRR